MSLSSEYMDTRSFPRVVVPEGQYLYWEITATPAMTVVIGVSAEGLIYGKAFSAISRRPGGMVLFRLCIAWP